MDIRDDDLRAIARLWHELDEIPAAASGEALTHCFARLAQIVGANDVFWVAAARPNGQADDDHQLRGWQPRAVQFLHPHPARDQAVAEIVRKAKDNVVDPSTAELVARAGATRAFLRRQLVDNETWDRSFVVNEAMRPFGIEHRLVGAHTVDAGLESYFGLDRGPRDKPFAERERDLLYLFLLGCPGFHREQMLAYGIAAPALSPRERDVLRLLLTDLSEREIAQALGLTPRTTHQYVVAVLRKFGVKGRVGLMAHWLRHRAVTP